MRVLLIDPPFYRIMGMHRFYYPIGLASMAAVLKQAGHSVKIYDAEHTKEANTLTWSQVAQRYEEYPKALDDAGHELWSEARKVIADLDPDLVGISMLTPKARSANNVAQISKELKPYVPVVVGADHPTVLPEYALRDTNIDYAVRGEGEYTLLDLVTCLENRGGRGIETLNGISYRTKGGVRHTPNRQLIANLDSLPYPDLDALLDLDDYRPVDLGAIMASRGCPYSCTFCGVANIWTREVRFRSPGNILAEMKLLHERFGTTYFSFRDASFTLRRDHVIALCDLIHSAGLRVEWESVTRADWIDDPLVEAMVTAGCVTVRLGVESGSPELLKRMGKQLELDVIRQAARLLNRRKLYWAAYFLFGTPWETEESIRQTLEFIEEIQPPFVTVARYAPIPGTEMYYELEQAGRISPDIQWNRETNQRFASDYLFRMEPSKFEEWMKIVAAYAQQYNQNKSAEFQRRDGRLK